MLTTGRISRWFFLLISFLIANVQFGLSQTDPNGGILPFSTHVAGQYDVLDPATGNVMLSIPVMSKAGKIPFTFNLGANFNVWVAYNSGTYYWEQDPTSNAFSSRGVPSGDLGASLTYTTTHPSCNGNFTSQSIDSNFFVVEPNGTRHPVSGSLAPYYGACTTIGSGTYSTIDGSGYTVIAAIVGNSPQYTVYDRSGRNIGTGASAGTVTDTDGTTMSTSVTTSGSGSTLARLTIYTDTLGQVAVHSTEYLNRYLGTSSPDTYTYTDVSSSTQTVSVNYTAYHHQTNFGCTGIVDRDLGTAEFPTSIVLADGETFTLSYEDTAGFPGSKTGRLARITLPTGGYIAYSYSGSGGTGGTNCAPSAIRIKAIPTITRTINDGNGHTSQWTYVPSAELDSYGNFYVTVTDPALNTTTYHYHWPNFFPVLTETVNADSTGHVLSTKVICYNGNNSSQTGCIAPQTQLEYGPAGQIANGGPVKQTDIYTSLGSGSPTLVETKYDYNTTNGISFGDVLSVARYTVGTYPPSGSALSTATTTYANLNGVTCGSTQQYIHDHPCISTTTNASGVTLAQTNFTYNSGGHPTQIQNWVTGTTYLTSSATYNANGTTATSTDVNNQITNFFYNGVGGCNNLLLTSTALPVSSLTTSQTWNCVGGVITSTTDANSNVITYGYVDQNGVADPLWRQRSMTDPLLNKTWNNYSPTATPPTSETYMVFNGNASTTDSLTTYDGLGRVILQQTRQAPGSTNFDTVANTYDSIGHVATVSIPCVSTASVACASATTTTTYDGLSRPLLVTDGGGGTVSYGYSGNDVLITKGPAPTGENAKIRQLEYDGLGRMTSVCEVTNGTGSGACAQTTSKTGFWTKYTYDILGNLTGVTQNAQGTTQTRGYVYDGLSRLISETNPESGTTTYVNDTDPTCGTFNGDRVKKVDAAGNVNCFAYDGLHRPTAKTYPSGPYAANTPPKTFIYDATTFSCPTGANVKGRLAEAFTGPSGSKITDLAYCYSPRGETTDIYESTPHSAGYYHVPFTYWANGLLKSFGPFLGQTQQGYDPDGEGRAGDAYWMSGSNKFYSVPTITYNAASQPTQLMTSCAAGTCYPLSYTYDPNTGRMTQYSGGFNGGTISGSLTWNANGSLNQLAITNPINTADTQTCNYAADDLSRIASVNCGSTWAQTFSYDPFGNLTKSGSISWAPGYNQSTNHYTLGGTSYDANGNVLNDSFMAYTWDSDGKLLSSFNQAFLFTNDAFGHLAEVSINGSYQYSFVKFGNIRLSAAGQTASYSEFLLPGGSKISTAGGANGFQFADWLGTIRARYDSTGGHVQLSGAHAPFGESYDYSSYPMGFAGQGGVGMGEGSDGIVGNTTYWFPERQYRSSQGRWLSPDPAGLAAVDPASPQSWNRYAYVLNNPLSSVDPNGLWCVWDDGSGHDDEPSDGGVPQSACEGAGGHWDPTDTVFNMWQHDGIVTFMDTEEYGIIDVSNLQMTVGQLDQSWDAVTATMDAEENRYKNRPSDCGHYVDPLSTGFEVTGKLGAAVELANLSVGLNMLNKTFGSGEGPSSSIEFGYKGIFSIQGKRDNAWASNPLSWSATVLGFNYSSSGLKFNPTKEFKFGLQAGVGVEVGYNSDKVKQTIYQNKACGFSSHD